MAPAAAPGGEDTVLPDPAVTGDPPEEKTFESTAPPAPDPSDPKLLKLTVKLKPKDSYKPPSPATEGEARQYIAAFSKRPSKRAPLQPKGGSLPDDQWQWQHRVGELQHAVAGMCASLLNPGTRTPQGKPLTAKTKPARKTASLGLLQRRLGDMVSAEQSFLGSSISLMLDTNNCWREWRDGTNQLFRVTVEDSCMPTLDSRCSLDVPAPPAAAPYASHGDLDDPHIIRGWLDNLNQFAQQVEREAVPSGDTLAVRASALPCPSITHSHRSTHRALPSSWHHSLTPCGTARPSTHLHSRRCRARIDPRFPLTPWRVHVTASTGALKTRRIT